MTKQTRLIPLVVVMLFSCDCFLIAADRPAPVEIPPRRILAKLKAPLAQQVESAMSAPDLKIERPSPNLQHWLRLHGVNNLRPLYPAELRHKIESRKTHAQLADAIRKEFPKRTARQAALPNPPEVLRTYVLELTAASKPELRSALERLRADEQVEFAQLDQIVKTQVAPNDPYFSSAGSWGQAFDDLYGVKKIGGPAAWDVSIGSGVLVAVVDTGIGYRHGDITNQLWLNSREHPGNNRDDDDNGYVDDFRGWDFVGASDASPRPDNDPNDEVEGHGTHVAGTIAAEGNNYRGIIGVAWGAKVMAVKGLDDTGSGTDSTVANAIVYAANNGADVINASWGGHGTAPIVEDAVNYAVNLGVVFVAAAGNDNSDFSGFYPASFPAVISVSAVDAFDNKAYFSNFGNRLDVAAPGVDVLSLRAPNTSIGTPLNNEYTRASGTSMAAPHASGVAALILSLHPDYSPEEVRQVLRLSARDILTPGVDLQSGYGRIDASNAVRFGSVLQARIFSPTNGTIASSLLTISGVAQGVNFSNYILDYGVGDTPTNWIVLTNSATPVNRSQLGQFDSLTVPDGRYALRLRAFNTSGQIFTDRLSINVAAVFIAAPRPPHVRSTALTVKPGVTLPIIGNATGLNFHQFRLQWARGVNASSGWSSSDLTWNGGGSQSVTNGLLATWDTRSITQADFYTIRLQVENPTFTNEARTLVYFEPDLFSTNWPRCIEAGAAINSSVLPVRDASGQCSLVLAVPEQDTDVPARLWKFSLDGSVLQTNDLKQGSELQPAVVDLDGVPGQEVVATEYHDLLVFRPDGSSYVPTVANSFDFESSFVTVADLDGDGRPEMLALGREGGNTNAYLHAWKSSGVPSLGFPLPIPNLNNQLAFFAAHRIFPVDLDGDGKSEILVLAGESDSSFSLKAIRGDGSPFNWPNRTFTERFWDIAAADFDHDGRPEIVLAYDQPSGSFIEVLSAEGITLPGWPVLLPTRAQVHLAIADLDRDGTDEIIVAIYSTILVLKANGKTFSAAWPLQGGDFQPFGPVAVGDIDGDGFPEIVVGRDDEILLGGASSPTSYHNCQLRAYRRDGTLARSWRLPGANENQPFYEATPVIGDFNGDGKVDIAVNYPLIEGGGVDGWISGHVVTILSLGSPYRPNPHDWPMNYHDPQNTATALIAAKLRISNSGTNVVLSWPVQPSAPIVESSDSLTQAFWRAIFPPTITTNGWHTVTIESPNGSAFYRLKYFAP